MQEFLPAGKFTVKQHKALSHLGNPRLSHTKSNKKVEPQGESRYNIDIKAREEEQMTISNKMAILVTSNAFKDATITDVAWGVGLGLAVCAIAIGAVLLINHFTN